MSLPPLINRREILLGAEMVRLIQRKKLSARELIEAHLKQIERINRKVNAIVTLTVERALESARKADEAQARGAKLGPSHGLPVIGFVSGSQIFSVV